MATSSIRTYSNQQTPRSSLERALAAAQVAFENRGQDIVILDMREVTPVFDYFVLVTGGGSRRHLHAISDDIDNSLEGELGDHRIGIEGYQESRWVLLDYGDVVIHIFAPECREYYDIEQLWCEAKRVEFEPKHCPNLRVSE